MLGNEVHYFDSDNNYNNYDYEELIQKRCKNTYEIFKKKIEKNIIFGEKTPSYINFKKAIDRIHDYNPNIKLIIILRDPISRAWSHFNMNLNKDNINTENIDVNELFFEKIMEKKDENHYFLDDYIGEKELTDYYIVNKGYYIDQINYVLTKFSKEQLHISISEEILNNPNKEYNKILNF